MRLIDWLRRGRVGAPIFLVLELLTMALCLWGLIILSVKPLWVVGLVMSLFNVMQQVDVMLYERRKLTDEQRRNRTRNRYTSSNK